MGDYWDVIKIFGTAFGAIIVWILGSKVFESIAGKIIDRRFQRQDQRDAIHESNQTAQIEFDKLAFQRIVERLDKVENQLNEVRDKLSSQMERNARLEVENQHLKETNERQEIEIKDLRHREGILNQQITSLTNMVVKLQTELDQIKERENSKDK